MSLIPWVSGWLERVFNYTIYRVDKGGVPHPLNERLAETCIFKDMRSIVEDDDLGIPPTGYAEH